MMCSKSSTSALSILVHLSFFVLARAVSLSVSIPATAPPSSIELNPALLSFSIEQDRWTDWAGTASPNTFFLNALSNLAKRTGQTPWIRIGANSEDKTNFNPDVMYSEAIFPAVTTTTPYPEASNITVGFDYYKLASHLPAGTHVIWGVNFGQKNMTAAVLEALAIKSAFHSPAIVNAGITLDFIEIGNEADLYSTNGDRPASNWTIEEYVKEWTAFATEVAAAGGVSSKSETKFLGLSFADSSHSSSSFSPQGAFANNILGSKPGNHITAISQHHYSGSFCEGSGGLLQDLMSKSTIRSNLTEFSPDIQAVQAKGLDYILGETNSYSCHGAPGVSNTAGAALWTLDYTLFASQIGISRIHYHEGIGFKYNLIQPVTLTRSTLNGSTLAEPEKPHVQPQYYAGLIVGEAIGTKGATGVEIQIDDPFLAGYAFFESGDLKRAVFINSQAWFSTSIGSRPIKTITLSIAEGNSTISDVQVKRLNIGHADDVSGLTWGGQTFETSNAMPSGKKVTEKLSLDQPFNISATEAVLLYFS